MRAPGMTHVPHADLHLEHAGHQPADPVHLPGAHGRAGHAVHRSPPGRPFFDPAAGRRARSSGSTSSGSSATPRSTSSSCRSSGSCPRSSPSSPASRSSATAASMVLPLVLIGAAVVQRLGAPHVRDRRRSTCRSSPLTSLIAIPTGIKFFNWIATMWRGKAADSRRRCSSAIGFLFMFLIGGLTGVFSPRPRSTTT